MKYNVGEFIPFEMNATIAGTGTITLPNHFANRSGSWHTNVSTTITVANAESVVSINGQDYENGKHVVEMKVPPRHGHPTYAIEYAVPSGTADIQIELFIPRL